MQMVTVIAKSNSLYGSEADDQLTADAEWTLTFKAEDPCNNPNEITLAANGESQ